MSAKHYHAHWLPETTVPTTSPGAAFLTFFCALWAVVVPLVAAGLRWR